MTARLLPLCIAHHEVTYLPRALSGSAHVKMGWSVADDNTSPLCAGFASWEGHDSPFKTLNYDEILLVLEGRFGFELEDAQRFTGLPGDTLRIPKGTRVRYFGENAKVFFVINQPTPLN